MSNKRCKNNNIQAGYKRVIPNKGTKVNVNIGKSNQTLCISLFHNALDLESFDSDTSSSDGSSAYNCDSMCNSSVNSRNNL